MVRETMASKDIAFELDLFFRDAQYALRQLRRSPAFAVPSSLHWHSALERIPPSLVLWMRFGVAPAGHVRLTDLRSILNETERVGAGRHARALRNMLVVSEISLALPLLMGAGLFVRSLNRLAAVNLGFSDDHILVAYLPVPPAGTAPADARRIMDFYETTLRQLHALFFPVRWKGLETTPEVQR